MKTRTTRTLVASSMITLVAAAAFALTWNAPASAHALDAGPSALAPADLPSEADARAHADDEPYVEVTATVGPAEALLDSRDVERAAETSTVQPPEAASASADASGAKTEGPGPAAREGATYTGTAAENHSIGAPGRAEEEGADDDELGSVPEDQGEPKYVNLSYGLPGRSASAGAPSVDVPASEGSQIDVPGASTPSSCDVDACHESTPLGFDLWTAPVPAQSARVNATRVCTPDGFVCVLIADRTVNLTPEIAPQHVSYEGEIPALCAFADGAMCLDGEEVNGTSVKTPGFPGVHTPWLWLDAYTSDLTVWISDSGEGWTFGPISDTMNLPGGMGTLELSVCPSGCILPGLPGYGYEGEGGAALVSEGSDPLVVEP